MNSDKERVISENVKKLGLGALHKNSLAMGEELFQGYKDILSKHRKGQFDEMEPTLLEMQKDIKTWIRVLKLMKKQAQKVENATRYTEEVKKDIN